ncbi:TlyA family RNA methyltransferase [Thermosediminibacter oceani]|uniref:Hemolysin A n=1 Tax=Thermosediminibacter oceani (strain ATCC BAA-1034 / DSM 16646 / JW/IW-1228P) TaxID=555079 RepID=D9S3T4_THEOJ|nr:TlyA family RNA methyltransferase [Thermosediminibacter oceani]ADL08061.1 hemolysin A [Thermosediminibacter oceani DSM 16646]
MQKERLDVLLVQRGLFSSRERAKSEIMMGNVFVNNKKIDKPGTMVDINSDIIVKERSLPYVSRGGLKLKKALTAFSIDVRGKVALDAGASTGGFTDCLLKEGATKVYAVDVGYGQLDYSLRNDPRVVNIERKNIRYIRFEDIGELVDIITADLSFISLSKVFEPLYSILKEDGDLITLIKPQFEVGKSEVKNGVVRDRKLHEKAISEVIASAEVAGFFCRGVTFSPIKGPKGNIEFLAWFKKYRDIDSKIDIKKIVEEAHTLLN